MIIKTLSKSIFLLFILVIITCVIYPLILLIIGQVFFPFQANGSILYDENHNTMGSKLIAQPFTQEQFFKPRPSAAAYNASASASSALAASNVALRDRVVRSLGSILNVSDLATGENFDKWQEEHPDVKLQPVPADMVTTSASGLDPHITLQNAEYQLNRIAAKWASILHRDPLDVRKEIEQILQQHAFAPLGGLAGERLINVLEVNLDLKKRYNQPNIL